MLDDKSLGVMIILFSLIFMGGYFVWAFPWIFGESINSFIGPVSDWAFKLPVVAAVYVILGIVLWIGYTMATTPPPMPIEKPLEIEREEASGFEEEEEKEN